MNATAWPDVAAACNCSVFFKEDRLNVIDVVLAVVYGALENSALGREVTFDHFAVVLNLVLSETGRPPIWAAGREMGARG